MTSLWTPARRLAVWSLAAALFAAPGEEIIDKIVAVVGNRAITGSELDQQIRLQSLINGQPAEFTAQKRREALTRLIERQLVKQEMGVGTFLDPEEQAVEQELQQLRQRRYLGSLTFSKALEVYELKEEDVRAFLRESHGFLRFIDFRFRTGIVIDRSQVEAYYNNVFVPEYRRGTPAEPPPLEKVYQRIEEILLEEHVNRSLDVWLREVRARTRVDILDQSLRRGGQ